ncbi:Uncharacterised protein [Plesiomonas shigelloides]|nr:Uncharacterised protein [Plesiomonas shigelloides]
MKGRRIRKRGHNPRNFVLPLADLFTHFFTYIVRCSQPREGHAKVREDYSAGLSLPEVVS